jgi:hypothetical protein
MILLNDGSLDLMKSEVQLNELEDFLATNPELHETKAGGLQEFFDQRLDLLLLLGDVFGAGFWPAKYKKEFSIFNEFRADYVVSNAEMSKFLFIEFEDAKSDSIFSRKGNSKSTISYEWSSRFEHGFSQVLDWHFRIDDFRRSSKMKEHFGRQDIEYEGLLVIGRDAALTAQGTEDRLKWRKENVTVNSRRIGCVTFDQLLAEVRGRLKNIRLMHSMPN